MTGEVESNLHGALLNGAAHPDISDKDRMPFGYPDTIVLPTGETRTGNMVPAPVWLIQGSDRTILIDTGLGDVAEAIAVPARYGSPYMASRSEEQDIVAGLAQYGVEPQDIDTVVLTHLHYDHIGNNELFSNATFIVQKDELDLALNPPKFCMFYFPEYAYKLSVVADRLVVIDGDYEINDDVRLIKIGGHTPGCQSVLVKIDGAVVCLTSDVMYNYRNLELDWPIGSFWNLKELISGYKRIRREADIIVPQHDWQIFDKHPTGTIR
ncbi:N-acyl homoserine lactonase family protein [Paenarthrobacter sp. NPDC057981]|uniref:N-acyl homoserine lactonase family protein n=1 Tax=Paenarthrobacter sp. NPDC057981 TaxID=3346297 RepID=UPI0036D8E68F